jgi:hypothetical protein
VLGDGVSNGGAKNHRVVSIARPGVTDVDHFAITSTHDDLHVHRSAVILA